MSTPPFATPFTCIDAGEQTLTVRHAARGLWWRFAVAEKNGRLQLVHDAHGADAENVVADERTALDAYDFATLEARRKGWVD